MAVYEHQRSPQSVVIFLMESHLRMYMNLSTTSSDDDSPFTTLLNNMLSGLYLLFHMQTVVNECASGLFQMGIERTITGTVSARLLKLRIDFGRSYQNIAR